MSNLDQRPAESALGVLPQQGAESLVLAPREVPLGGPRAMVVRRTLPHRALRTVGAWCFLDDYGPHEVSGSSGMHVPPHPHTGLQTVTWLLDGEVRHRDSLGNDAEVRPGELNLMTAGRGISHAETSSAAYAGPLRGLQLWVALPAQQRDIAPGFAHHADLPCVSAGGLTVRVVLGTLAGHRSPAAAYTPIVGAELTLAASAGTGLELEPAFEHAVLALDDVTVGREPLPAGSLAYLPPGARSLRLGAGDQGGRAFLVGGEPFDEDLLMWWNFVARSHDEIVAAREEWMAAVDGAETRFGRVTAYDGPALSAPALPTSRLRPRRRT